MSCQTCLHNVGADIDADSFIACGELPVVGGPSRRQQLLIVAAGQSRPASVRVDRYKVCTAASSSSLLDVVIASRTTRRLQQLAVQPSHDVSDHDLVTRLFSVKCRPPPQFLT